jgi:hypothetical protein
MSTRTGVREASAATPALSPPVGSGPSFCKDAIIRPQWRPGHVDALLSFRALSPTARSSPTVPPEAYFVRKRGMQAE